MQKPLKKYRPPNKIDRNIGYIYLIEEKSEGHIKIGRSKNLSNRLKTFNVKLPFKIDYIYSFKTPDCIYAERELHKHFGANRVNGEWFKLSPHWIELIINKSLLNDLNIEVLPCS